MTIAIAHTRTARFRLGRLAGLAAAVMAALAFAFSGGPAVTAAPGADPAVIFMAKVGKELMAAARTNSPGVMTSVVERYGDVAQIGLYSLGEYRSQLAQADRPSYYAGMARFIGRYAITEAPKYRVERVEWANQSTRGSSGIMVDSRITLADGSSYDVRWLLFKYGNTYKIRDASVLGIWMTPFLKDFFEGYIAKNGGSLRSLTTALNR
jgi:phospholipid transport system substrate-binding protein